MAEPHYYSRDGEQRGATGTVRLRLADMELELASGPGVFAADAVDRGTRYLLAEVPPPRAQGPLLDLGCGYGPIAAVLARRAPAAPLWAVDVNPQALELCARNLAQAPTATVCLPEEVPAELRFAGIYSNPPIRIGKAALHELLEGWLDRLLPDGQAWLVVHKHLGSDSLARWLQAQGWATRRVGSRRGYRLLEVAARPAT